LLIFCLMKTQELLYYPVLDTKRPKALALEKAIQAWLYQNITFDKEKANAFLVAWGDGFMLDAMKTYFDEQKIFFGVNCGTLWFLLNEGELQDLPKTMEEVDVVALHPMRVDIVTKDNKRHLLYAMNDVVIGGNILDYFSFGVSWLSLEKTIQGTGLILSTALGSSWYWLGNGGPVLPMQSNLWGVMGLASKPFNYHLMKPQSFHVIPQWRTPVMVGVDGYGGRVDDVAEVTISPSNKTISLWFFAHHDFDSKRIALSNQKLWGM